METPKAAALALIQAQPDDCTWEQIAYRMYLQASVERSLAEIDAGQGIPHEQVMQEIEEWLASLGVPMPAATTNAI